MSSSFAPAFLADVGGDFALARKVFAANVNEAFREKTILFNNSPAVIASKVLVQAYSEQFLLHADLPDPEYHTPGQFLAGQQFEIGEGTISLDMLLTQHNNVRYDQMIVSQIPIVSQLGRKQGFGLARFMDRQLFRLAVNAARAPAVSKNGLNIHNGGNRVERIAANKETAYPVSAVGAQNFRADVAALAQNMDEDHVPESGRYLMITPYIRRVLGQDSTIFNVDFSPGNGNNLNQRAIGILEGFMVVVAEDHIPNENFTTGLEKYRGDYTVGGAFGEPQAIALCGASEGSAAIGLVIGEGITSVAVPDHQRSTMFLKSMMYMGAGILHPWCAGTIEVAAS